MIKTELEKFIQKVISCLEESDIRYVIIGGVAAIYWGRPRTTLDVDVIIDFTNRGEITKLEKTLGQNNFSFHKNEILEAINEKSHCNIFHVDFPYRIDLQGVYESIDSRSMKNRLKLTIFNQDTYIETPEDLIIAKIKYGSSLDIEDVHSILLRQKKQINVNYLQSIAQIEKIEKQLAVIISELKIDF